MGTRNLTAVYLDGEYKVAQYGQWDGYPSGQGITCLHFLRDKCRLDQFREKVRKVEFITKEERNSLLKEFGMKEDGLISLEDYDRFKHEYPELHRDMAADVLEYIQEGRDGMRLENGITFAANSLFCEYAWVIDLDAGTFEGYVGFNQSPLTPDDRFFFLSEYEDDGYHGVKLVAKWPIEELPSDEIFLSAFEDCEDGGQNDD